MRSRQKPRAFLSSTFEDLRHHRERALADLLGCGFDVEAMEHWTADTEAPSMLSQDRVRDCDLCVLLVGERIGHVPEGATKSVTQLEYEAAMAEGLDVLVFISSDDATENLKGRSKKARAAREWRAALRERHAVEFFERDPGSVHVAPALARWMAGRKGEPLVARNLPAPRNPNFLGRDDLLEELQAAREAGRDGRLAQVLVGLGGVGKSQIALEYAYRFESEYSAVWWIRAETEEGQLEDLAALARELKLPEAEGSDVSEAAGAALRWLRRGMGWLLILDNAVDPRSVERFFTGDGAGHLLLTSRNPSWGGVASVHEVPTLERKDSVAFLTAAVPGADPTEAEELADELGDLALALEQARAFVERSGDSLGRYLELYRAHGARLRERGPEPMLYPSSVGTTWSVSIERLEGEDATAGALLESLSLVAPDPLPLAFFESNGIPADPAKLVFDPLDLSDARAAIRRYALARIADDSVAMHRVVQAVVHDRLTEDRRDALGGALVALFEARLASESEERPDPAPLLPHAARLSDAALAAGRRTEPLARLLRSLGHHFHRRAEYARAARAFAAAAELAETFWGRESEDFVRSSMHLGVSAVSAGDFEEGREAVRQARAAAEAWAEDDPRGAAECLWEMCRCARDIHERELEAEVAERALELARGVFDPDDPKIAIYMHGVASAVHGLGQLERAKDLHERGLEITEKAHGPDHIDIAMNLGCLGDVLRDMGDGAGAVQRRERALEIFEGHHGPDDPVTASALDYLMVSYGFAGRFDEARKAGERAVRIFEATYGPDHPRVAESLVHLAQSLGRQRGDVDAAEPLARRALEISDRTLGPNRIEAEWAIHLLIDAAHHHGRWAEVLDFAERLSWIGRSDPRASKALIHLATFLRGQCALERDGDVEGALALCEEALTGYRSLDDGGDGMVETVTTWVAGLLQRRGEAALEPRPGPDEDFPDDFEAWRAERLDPAAAKTAFEEAVDHLREVSGPGRPHLCPQLAAALWWLSRAHLALDEPGEALASARQGLEALEASPDPPPQQRAGLLRCVASAHIQNGEPETALIAARQGLAELEEIADPEDDGFGLSDYHRFVAHVALEADAWDECRAALESYLRLDPYGSFAVGSDTCSRSGCGSPAGAFTVLNGDEVERVLVCYAHAAELMATEWREAREKERE